MTGSNGANSGGVSTTYVRREAWTLASTTDFDPITLAYANAIKVMQARPASDPTSWVYQGAIHATYSVPPTGATWNACQHQSWFFLPWHRMYLYYFERILRNAVLDADGPADFALPYWNYDRPFPGNTLPPAFRMPTLPDGSANPLFIASPGRRAALMAGGQVPATATTSAAAMALTNFSSAFTAPSFGGGRVGPAHFGGALGSLETTPHNVMHGLIGGPIISGACADALMSDPRCAALDPIFWLHHANIDRLWNVWLALGGGRANPSESPWLSQSFVFHDESGAQVTLTGADIVDSAGQLGYVYDDVSVPGFVRPLMVSTSLPPAQPPELAAASEESLTLAGNAVSVELAMPQSARQMVEEAGEARRILINVEDIEAERDPGLPYAVFLEAPGGDRRHIGNVSFFGIETMNDPDRPHEGVPGFRHSFDATAAVAELQAQGILNQPVLTVTFEPIRVVPPPGGEIPAEAAQFGPVSPVRIGRVSLFLD
jgi:hypothetical protein